MCPGAKMQQRRVETSKKQAPASKHRSTRTRNAIYEDTRGKRVASL
ncbi:hypothetical protein HanHA300_Chr11g0421381 [Helianthus annuus]|nr:hypothetical protein HanHA300_Chr11g0421381 [Helianthus annuus]KAJ0519144.1 hypothetical protein HanHA89_Chr11g0445521 [Helianthus annuus]